MMKMRCAAAGHVVVKVETAGLCYSMTTDWATLSLSHVPQMVSLNKQFLHEMPNQVIGIRKL